MILAYFGQNLVALEPCNQKCLQIGRPPWLPVISNHIPVVARRNVFIAMLVQKLVAMVTSLCPLCTGVSQMILLIAQTLPQNQTLLGYVTYNWSYGHFVIFVIICDYFAKTWLPWQRLLDTCNQKCLLWIGRPRKPPVISNHILAICGRNAFIAILVPNLVAMVMRFCRLCTEVSQMNSLIAQTQSQNQTQHGCVA